MRKKLRYHKLPGSRRQRTKARNLLKCHEFMKNIWTVWGGRSSHIVKREDGYISCDCQSFEEKGVCSHLIKIKMVLGEFPEYPVLK